MSLPAGSRLGPYEITGALGAGGMERSTAPANSPIRGYDVAPDGRRFSNGSRQRAVVRAAADADDPRAELVRRVETESANQIGIMLMDVSERFEQLIAFVSSQLPKPVEEQQGGDGSILFTGGEPPEVIVHLTDQTVVVSEFAGEWEEGRFSLTPLLVGEL